MVAGLLKVDTEGDTGQRSEKVTKSKGSDTTDG
jgi:hypothetical protein